MLKHTVEFAQRHSILGAVSESSMESFHATFNSLLNDHHFNILLKISRNVYAAL